LLPVARLVVLSGRRRIDPVMQPAMPARRDRRCFRIAIIDDPAAVLAVRGGSALLIYVSKFVLTDTLSAPPCLNTCVEALAIPPGEQLRENLLHHILVAERRRIIPLMASA